MSRLILVAVAALFAGPAAAQDRYVKLVQADTGKVLTIADESDEPGARAVVAREGTSHAQHWKLEKDGSFYKLVNRKTGKVLDVFEDSAEEGAAIIQWDDKSEGADNQRWIWLGDGPRRRLQSKSSRLVLDVDDEGKVVQKKADDGAKGQFWKVVEVN
jgi:hypothetical protein